MSTDKSLDDLTFFDAVSVTLPAGTAYRAVAQMVRKQGVQDTMAQLAKEALDSGRYATYPDAMRFAADRISDLSRFLAGEQTEVNAYRKMKAEQARIDATGNMLRTA